MTFTIIILLVLALYMVQIFLQETSRFGFDLKKIIGNRDTLPEMSKIAARLDRAKNNMLESLPFFLGIAMLVLIKDGDNTMAMDGAIIYMVARIIYVPAYLSGIPMLRSFIWIASNAGLVMMVLSLF